jgi:hypothetical protein
MIMNKVMLDAAETVLDLLALIRQFMAVLFRKKVRKCHERLREERTKDMQAD